MVDKRVPELRFEGFDGDWEQRKLGELTSEFKSGSSIKAENIFELGSFPVYGGNGFRGYTDTFNHDGDFALIGRQGALSGNMNFSVGKAYFTEHAVAVKANENNDTRFLYYLMDKLKLGRWVTQSAQPGLAVGTLTEIKASVPNNFEEQQKIGIFFKQLDDTTALHQQKLDQLKRLKQSFLQILFGNKEQAPKVRFAGFDEEWEQRKLRDSIKVMDGDRGSNYPHDSDFFENGDTLFLDTGNVTKNGFKFDSVKYITKEKDEQLRSGKLEKNDFVLTSRGTLGNVGFYDELVYKLHPKLRINSAMLILRNTDKQLSYSYLHTLLKGKLISDFMRKNQVGSAQPHITKSEFLKLDLNVPCGTEEQNKVGEFFKNLDHTINLHQTKLEKLKQLKQAFLQKMFI